MLVLNTYEDWKHCITVDCGIPLTREYVQQRLAALHDPKDYSRERFVAVWGEEHLTRVIGWFQQAERELG